MSATGDSLIQIQCPNCHSQWPYPTHELRQCPDCDYKVGWDQGILLLGGESSEQDYSSDAYAVLFEIEDRHFWFSGRNLVIEQALRKSVGSLQDRYLLEVGCGTGKVLSYLERLGLRAFGLEMHLEGLRYARRRTMAPLICCNAAEIPFVEQFDILTLCDVLEHVEDENALLMECSKALKPQGSLLLTVPANMQLWSTIDDLSGHKRRYDVAGLRTVLQDASFKVTLIRYFNSLLFPVQYLFRKIQDYRESQNNLDATNRVGFLTRSMAPPTFVNQLLLGVIKIESRLLRWVTWPFGASIVVVAQKGLGN
jgi:2-polyprenyl-3-methyl-5-hydroxy-6-metoxy-1,4-benzoquinol methylase